MDKNDIICLQCVIINFIFMKKFIVSMVLLLITVTMAVIESRTAVGLPTLESLGMQSLMIGLCDLVFMFLVVMVLLTTKSWKLVVWTMLGAVLLSAFMPCGVQFAQCIWDYCSQISMSDKQLLWAACLMAFYIVGVYAVAIYIFLKVYCNLKVN